MHSALDHGYKSVSYCVACRSPESFCCDGNGGRLPFAEWSQFVDREICRLEETETNQTEAPYAEMYQDGLSVMAAVEKALA